MLFQVCALLRHRQTLDHCPINIQATLSPMELQVCIILICDTVTRLMGDLYAVDGLDYGHISTILHFPRCQTVSCTNMSIVDDVKMEALRETFSLVLGNTDQDSRISVSTQPSAVYIEDDDGIIQPCGD